MRGLVLAFSAYFVWGSFPLFFSLLNHVAPMEVLVQRIVWAFLATLVVIVLMRRRASYVALLQNRRAMAWLLLSGVLIGLNWLVFIWAVSVGRVLETSLGYFLTPLVSLMLGRILLKETMNRFQAVAGALAAVAVLFELVALGHLPWVSLLLAGSFGFYGLVRKQQPVDSLQGLNVEALVLLPVAAIWLLWQVSTGGVIQFGSDLRTTLLLVASGAVTAVPLLLFAAAARRLDLTVVGFIMYVNPTMQFLTAVFIFNEPYPPLRLVTFAIIWVAMVVFMLGLWRSAQQRRQAARLV
ncbi:EamA family transporter RarD [Salinispirillum sp. LH 10-3-1]|uniref:EamA family transporter RarD n=1 Tax=Salinispirillum sp. LH 10-3-1 TaxID=2952525 RepID=A0AB38YG31_9GAMM